ncbi:hypothetical protein QI212_02140 [Staphylococcus saprophyticus]|uniref:hypothetical protein n=1 Tax=Staphylococcus sp. 231237_7MaSpsaltlick TaxID=3367518 RepID=UPI0029776A99|nr:hypothetical protein [Staphylococcus saprophyticus]
MIDVQAKLIENAYMKAKKEKLVIVDNSLYFLGDNEKFLLDSFHTNEVATVEKNDSYFCGSRANTFVVMFGWNEQFENKDIVLIQSNHKGNLNFTMFEY